MGNSTAQVTPFAGERDRASVVRIEVRTQRNELAHRFGPLGDQDRDGILIAQTRTCDDCVNEVVLRGIIVGQSSRDATLCPRGGALLHLRLRDEQDCAASRPQSECRRQACDTGTDHDGIGTRCPPWFGCEQSTRHPCGLTNRPVVEDGHGPPTVHGMLSINRVEPTCAAISTRPGPGRAVPRSASVTAR